MTVIPHSQPVLKDKVHKAGVAYQATDVSLRVALFVQLAAGAEHLISGKTVRVNLAGPRPELPLLYMDPSQTQPILLPQTTGKHPTDIPLLDSALYWGDAAKFHRSASSRGRHNIRSFTHVIC